MKQHQHYGVAFTVSLLIGGIGCIPAWASELNSSSEIEPGTQRADVELITPSYFEQICEDLKENQRQACEETCRSVEGTPEFEDGFCGFGSVCQCTDKGDQTP